MKHSALPHALLTLALLGPAIGAEAAPFCVEDEDDALWIDCRTNLTGVTRRERILCRRAPGATLMEVTGVARRLAPGQGDCPPAGGPSGPRLVRDGLPRTGDDDETGPAGTAAAPAHDGTAESAGHD